MDIKKYTRKPFPVDVVQVTLQNVHEAAAWCGGTVVEETARLMGTQMQVPVIKIDGKGENRGKVFSAGLGCYIVELKGNYRVYKPPTFEATFDELVEEEPTSDVWGGEASLGGVEDLSQISPDEYAEQANS